MFIIDFDDTLFDTQAFKAARLASLTSLGIDQDMFKKTYAEARNTPGGIFTYSDERHAQVLAAEGFDEKKVVQALKAVAGDIKKFLFPDTLRFLQEIREKGEPMILLSLGDPTFQEFKVKQTRVHKFFDRMFFVDTAKENIVKEVLTHHSPTFAWFINDKVKETKDLAEKFSALKPILKQSPNIFEQEYRNSGLPYFQTLSEILEYVR